MSIDGEQYFIDLYMSAKRNMMKNNFIKPPKIGSKQHQNLIDAANLVEELHTNPIDFIQFFIKRLAPLRIFPQPYHLVSKKLVEKYRYHQVLKNVYECPEYSIDGDSFLIHVTLETVSYRNDIMVPVEKDMRVRWATSISNQKDYILSNQDRRDVEYTIAKLRFLEKPIPENLSKVKGVL